MKKRGSPDLRKAATEVAKDNRGLPLEQKREIVKALTDQGPAWDALKRVEATASDRLAEARAAVEKARVTFAESGSADDAIALDVARNAEALVKQHWREKTGIARGAWQRACDRSKREAEYAEDLALLLSVLDGAEIDLSYGRFKANCPSVERRPWLFKLPRLVLYELAHQARRTGKLPTEEEAAQASAAAIPIEQFRIAQNSDRPQGGFISFGSHAVEQDCDQVSEEQVAELCKALERIPTQDEVRGLYKQRLSRGELRAEEARARAEAIKNSPGTQRLRAYSEKVRANLLAEQGTK